mmetsp:Transcript_27063/g.62242  ORF Transcript_27063/g.62242 Transcript_27063/m.62242 type:complete len:96 (-) Transcript_27063:96-383(-)
MEQKIDGQPVRQPSDAGGHEGDSKVGPWAAAEFLDGAAQGTPREGVVMGSRRKRRGEDIGGVGHGAAEVRKNGGAVQGRKRERGGDGSRCCAAKK